MPRAALSEGRAGYFVACSRRRISSGQHRRWQPAHLEHRAHLTFELQAQSLVPDVVRAHLVLQPVDANHDVADRVGAERPRGHAHRKFEDLASEQVLGNDARPYGFFGTWSPTMAKKDNESLRGFARMERS